MKASLFQRLADGFGGDAVTELRVRIFRLICALTGALCLGLVAPLNAFQNMPVVVHVSNIVLGLAGAFCYWQSCRGRHFIAAFFVLLVVLLDVVWFYNAGSDGSVTHYYYPVMLFIIALFQGRKRGVLAIGLWLNVSALFILEHYYPNWVTPFQSADDRLTDIETGVLCSFVALASVTWFIIVNYNREQRRVSEMAAQLVASESSYREIFNATSDALFIHRADGLILDVNEQTCALLGAPKDKIVGRLVGDFSLGQSPYSQKEATALAELAQAGRPQTTEWRGRRASGELFWSEVAMRVWEAGGEKRVVAAVRDISERKKAQENLRLNEERLRLAMEASRQGWFELNVQTGESISSPEYVRMLGYDPEGFKSDFQTWLARIHPADRTEAAETYARSVRAGGLAALEYRQQTKSGAYKWIRSVAKVVEYDAAGRPLRVMGTHGDITERKELEGQLLHSQRLEAVGTLASGVAHDLNNILTPMLMASGILREKLADPKDRELMARLDDGGRRGAAIVRQLLDFSRNLAQDRLPLNPRAMLQEMAQLMRATFPKEITIVESIAPGTDMVEAESNQLHQVLMNLCVNARDAMETGGRITLGLERVEIAAIPGALATPHLALSVTDTGAGIPPENLGRIFDPFFTTKPLGKGTGLGLATVHGIVKAHHGFVRVESKVGQGTTFRVYLPVKSGVAPAAAPAPAAAVAPAPEKGGSILVVDDDPAVLLVTGRMLERIGYTVFKAASAAEALAALPRHREVVLVVTDFSMPGMDGPTLAPLLREISPGLRIIGVSGLKQDHRAAELARIGFSEVLSKPYEWEDLVRAVQRHMPVPAA